MTHSKEKTSACVVGFADNEKAILLNFAAKVRLPTITLPGNNDCLRVLAAQPQFLVLLDVDGIEVFGPNFVAELKAADPTLTVICLGGMSFPALEEHLERAGADLVIHKPVALSALDQCAAGDTAPTIIDAVGPEGFVKYQIAKKRHILKQRKRTW